MARRDNSDPVPVQPPLRWRKFRPALVDLVLSLTALANFDRDAQGFQLVEQIEWIPTLNIQYSLGVDGISVLFLPLTVLLFIGALLASWSSAGNQPRLYYTLMLMLILESATLGIFRALDTILFFLFRELTLVPTFFLISLWGVGPHRRYAAVKYTLMMLAGGVPLLFGFLLLAFQHAALNGATLPDGLVFDYPTLLSATLQPDLQGRELLVVSVMAILILVGGLYPNGILDPTRVASEAWVQNLDIR